MTTKQLEQLLDAGDVSAVVKAISVPPKKRETKYLQTTKELSPLEEYDVEDHPVFDKIERKDKDIKSSNPQEKKVARIGLAIEAYIASRAAAFLCGMPIKYTAAPEGDAEGNMWAAFKRVNEANKLDFKNQSILEMRMSELIVAEIWYLQELGADDDFWQGTKVNSAISPRLFLAAPSLDDKLWPVWDNDKLIALGRQWAEQTDNDKEVKHFDLYTKDKVYEWVQNGNAWADSDPESAGEEAAVDNPIGKLQVILHVQKKLEWAPVRSIIRRLESIYSYFADSNDRFAFPWLVVKGKTQSIPQGVSDKLMELQNGAEASFLTPPNAPEAIKLEVEQLWREVHRLTDTVDITNDSLNALGQTTGPALEFRFLPAHLKASKHAGTFGECIQRRINLIKTMIVACDSSLKAGMTLQIKPQFDFFLPKDVAGITNYLTTAVSGQTPLLSQETGVNILQSALGGDGKAEMEKIKAEPKPDVLGNAFDNAA